MPINAAQVVKTVTARAKHAARDMPDCAQPPDSRPAPIVTRSDRQALLPPDDGETLQIQSQWGKPRYPRGLGSVAEWQRCIWFWRIGVLPGAAQQYV